MLALGVVPVGTSEWYGEQPGALFPWAREKLGAAPLPTVLPPSETVSFERVAALKPDLILSLYGGLEQADYDKLSKIAPTVAQPAGVPSYSIPWEVQTEIVGKALGRPTQAMELVASVRARIVAAKAAHPEFAGKKALAGAWFNDQWYAYSSKDQRDACSVTSGSPCHRRSTRSRVPTSGRRSVSSAPTSSTSTRWSGSCSPAARKS